MFTLSVHGANNYPLRKEISRLDIELPDNTGDTEYLAAVERGIKEVVLVADAELVIYLAGADPYEGDRLGRMQVSKGALSRRDHMVIGACREAKLPVTVTMAGGYAKNIEDTVKIQFETVRIASEWAKRG